ncbi:recombinase family protein [Chloroflexota bacterium]
MKASIYCRVSTDDQEKEGTSLQTQREACLAYCNQKGYEVVRQFSETYSGLTLERPKLNELRDLIRSNNLDLVVVYCLDRISRDPTHGVILIQELENHNVTLEAVTETVESTDLGKLITYIRGFASKLEAEKIRERTTRGKQAYLKQGKLPQGTGIGIYGYEWNKDTGHRTINDLETKVVQRIFAMVLQGLSFHKIALELNKAGIKSKSGSMWHPLTIRRILNNPTYAGKTYYGMSKRVGKTKVIAQPKENWTLLPDITPPIISEEMFKRTQEVLLQAKQARPIKQNSPYLLTGFMKCSKCGSPVGGTTLNGKYRYYQCRGARPTATRGKICNAGYIKANDLEKAIWNKVAEMAFSPLTTLSLLSDIAITERTQCQKEDFLLSLDKEINHFRRKLKAYPDKEKNLYDLLSHESVTKNYVLDAVDRLKRERINDERQLKDLVATRKETTRANQVTVKLSELSEKLRLKTLQAQQSSPEPTENLDEIRHLLERLQLSVVVDNKPLDYKLTFKLAGQIISTEDSETDDLFNKLFKEFEQQHPDMNIEDIVDPSKPLPGNSPFAQSVNRAKKNLVTIEQTSG